jgi:predicted restriction endonuclease
MKIRKLDKAIGENLKSFYNFSCQICGKNVSEKYGANIVEAHHIEYFVTSLNNNAENIMVLCPNHHRIIHKLNPIFDRNNLFFQYPNGFFDKLSLYSHLQISR